MRAATLILAVLVLAVLAFESGRDADPSSPRTPQSRQWSGAQSPAPLDTSSPRARQSPQWPGAQAPDSSPQARLDTSSPRAPLDTSSPRARQSPQRPGAQAPDSLELVALPPLPGAPSPAPRTISRNEAVASVITSPEFQETVSPLARLYLATFGRYPDYEGLNYYTGQREQARPLDEIADEFAGSPEFVQRYGELDHSAFVELVFTNVLGNGTQADVRGYWVEALESGRMTRGQVLLDLAESGAFRERSAHQVFLATAYTEILRQTPDPAAYAYWLGQLRAGQPYQSVIDGLLASR